MTSTKAKARTKGSPKGRTQKRELEKALEAWTARLKVRSPNTARSYTQAVRRFLDEAGSSRLSVGSMSGYLESIEDLSPASRAHHVSAVRSFLRFAKDQGLVPESPEDLLVRPKVAVTSYGRYLTEDELRELLEAAKGLSIRHSAAVAGLALTGLRVSELTQAQWCDLFRDPDGRLGLRVLGKGSKERVVKVRDDLFGVLAELHGSADLDARDTSPLLPDRRGTAYTTRGLHKVVAQAVQAAGIRKPVSPHWLRHTHATLAAAGGAPAVVIQSSLGHSRLETSQRYIHWAKGLAETTVDALPVFG